jgi:hypothetical protein
MKTLLTLLVLLYATAAYAGRQAQVDVPDNSPVNVTISPTTKPTTAPSSAQVFIQTSAWAPVRDALIAAIVAVIGAGVPVLVIWLRSIGKRLETAGINATTALAAGQAAHSVAEHAASTANQALAAAPSVLAGGRRASDPPATVPPPAGPLGTLPVFPPRQDQGLKP